MAPELLPVPPTKGGAIERWVRDAAVRLSGRGHEVHVVSRDHGDGETAATIDGVHYHFIRIPPAIDRGLAAVMFRGLWYYAAVRGALARIAPDVVHHHSRPAGLWISSSRSAPGRQVISLHSMEYGWAFGYARWDRRLFAQGFAAAAKVLCVSDFIRRHTVERFPAVADKAITVYNGVDGNVFRPDAQALKPSSPQALTILYVGRVEERKGVHVLLDAFEKVVSPRLPEARLRIVGPHSYWDEQPSAFYQALAARCKTNPKIELQGPTYIDSELADVYRCATVSVVPSVFPEALGLTSLEAQASGVPVVVSDAGGLPETVSAGASGLVFENRNVEQLGQSLLALLEDEPRRRTMAKGARELAMKRFSWDVIAAQLEAVYQQVLATGHAR
ncbi:MAG: glycosyltransferase family 4 protein [Vicinamibacterales bacterium]